MPPGHACRCFFHPMKRKRKPKSAVPQGRIWWKDLKRHPLHAAFGAVIRDLRRLRGWSLDDLAGAADVAKSYLSALENGEHSPSLEVVLRLEAAFDFKPECLRRLANRRLKRQG